MAKGVRSLDHGAQPRRRARGVERVMIGVRGTPAQRDFLIRLGDGSLVVGFDRAVAAAVVAQSARR